MNLEQKNCATASRGLTAGEPCGTVPWFFLSVPLVPQISVPVPVRRDIKSAGTERDSLFDTSGFFVPRDFSNGTVQQIFVPVWTVSVPVPIPRIYNNEILEPFHCVTYFGNEHSKSRKMIFNMMFFLIQPNSTKSGSEFKINLRCSFFRNMRWHDFDFYLINFRDEKLVSTF